MPVFEFLRLRFLLLGLATLSSVAPAAQSGSAVPPGLRPVLYQTLARDAGPAIGKDGCATLPAQSLEACFTAAGARFTGAGVQPVSLRLTAWGRPDDLRPLAATAPTISGGRATYAHGTLREWWQALPIGFEQGFTITRRPRGQGGLALDLAASRKPQQGDRGLAFGQLRYGELVVTSANGKRVPADMSVHGTHVLITVDDAGADYPLTIDPIISVEQKVVANDGVAYDRFGQAVAISGQEAIVGAYSASVNGHPAQGAAYVFTQSNGIWSLAQKLTAADGVTNDQFGYSVAIYGPFAIVGAPYAKINQHGTQGAAYVFIDNAGTWSQTQKLTATDGEPQDQFGGAIAIDGRTAVIGARTATNSNGVGAGAAYVFEYSYANGGWNQTAKLTGPNVAHDLFGASVALSNGYAFVGVPGANSNAGPDAGAAYVFYNNGSGWTRVQKLAASNSASYDRFGGSIAASGTIVLVGADGALDHRGLAYVFVGSNGHWTETQALASDDGQVDQFGNAVAIDGNHAIVGAFDATVKGNPGQGAAFVFRNSGGTWTQTQVLTSSDGAADDEFGWSIALSGASVLIGARQANVNTNAYQGAAYFYDIPTAAPGRP